MTNRSAVEDAIGAVALLDEPKRRAAVRPRGRERRAGRPRRGGARRSGSAASSPPSTSIGSLRPGCSDRVPAARRPHRAGGGSSGQALPTSGPRVRCLVPAPPLRPRGGPHGDGPRSAGRRDWDRGRRQPLPASEGASTDGRASPERRGRGSPPALLGLLEVLRGAGYEPGRGHHGTLSLRNCPYDALAADHRDLTCGMNIAWAEGVVHGLGVRDVEVELETEPGRCCVVFHSEPGRREAPDRESRNSSFDGRCA